MEDFDSVDMKDDGLLRIETYKDYIHLSIHTDKNHVGRYINKENILKLVKILIKSLSVRKYYSFFSLFKVNFMISPRVKMRIGIAQKPVPQEV